MQQEIGTIGKPLTDVSVQLIGTDGNAFSILGKVTETLKQAGYDDEFINEYLEQATSGDYDNLLQVTMTYVYVE